MLKKQNLAKQLELQDATIRGKQSIDYMNMKAGEMWDNLALLLSGIQPAPNSTIGEPDEKIQYTIYSNICIFFVASCGCGHS